MYLVNINRVTEQDILKNIYNNIHCFNLSNRMFIIYTIDLLSDFDYRNIAAHAFLADLNQIKASLCKSLDELIMDMVEMNSNILIKPALDIESNKNFKKLAEEYGLSYQWYEKPIPKSVDIGNLSYNDRQIIKELFGEKTGPRFGRSSFMLRYTISPNGNVYDSNGKVVINLNNEQFIKVVFHMPEGIESFINDEMELYKSNSILNNKLYEPWQLIIDAEMKTGDIFDYKYKVFEAIKNISPVNYPKLSMEIAKLMNSNSYIQFKDALDIIQKLPG